MLQGSELGSWLFNVTFKNCLVISRWSVLLVEETRVPGENQRPVISHWQTLSHNVVSSTWEIFELATLVVKGTDYTGSCKSNYHTITTTTALCCKRCDYLWVTKLTWLPFFNLILLDKTLLGGNPDMDNMGSYFYLQYNISIQRISHLSRSITPHLIDINICYCWSQSMTMKHKFIMKVIENNFSFWESHRSGAAQEVMGTMAKF